MEQDKKKEGCPECRRLGKKELSSKFIIFNGIEFCSNEHAINYLFKRVQELEIKLSNN